MQNDPAAPSLLAGLVPEIAARLGAPEGELGLPDGAKPAAIAALLSGRSAPALIIAPTPAEADDLLQWLPIWLTPGQLERLHAFPTRDTAPYERQPPDPLAVEARHRALEALASDGAIVVASADAAAQRTLAPSGGRTAMSAGARLPRDELIAGLHALGYERARITAAPGEFAARGNIVDLWAPAEPQPVRIDLAEDETIESIRRFDPSTQRSVEPLDSFSIRPASEAAAVDGDDGFGLPEHFYTAFRARGTIWDHLPAEALLIIDEPAEVRRRAEERDERARHARDELLAQRAIPDDLPHPFQDADELSASLGAHADAVRLSRLGAARLPFRAAERLAGNVNGLVDKLDAESGARRFVLSLQAARLLDMLADYGLPVTEAPAESADPRAIRIGFAAPPEGWLLLDRSGEPAIELITDTEIFGFAKQRRAPRAAGGRSAPRTALDDLKPGDYLVHIDHGIGKFHGIATERIGGRELECLDLRYAQGDRLLVPTDQLHRVQPYVGPSSSPPAPTRLGTEQWRRAKARVRRAVEDIAEDLIELHAKRAALPGIPLAADGDLQLELEASFPFVETPDQREAIEAVRRDQEAAKPMDRIVIGDVGYGKTEIAVRAAFKAVTSGFQVAVLAPTTVLAQQHLATFSERLAAMPVRIDLLSRLRQPAEQRQTIADLQSGAVDIAIGTHRLIQKDVRFRNLGLLIIDEEQRFGVQHKERLKAMRAEVDVLTLSATPIPRSLHQALTGIRDMSTIATAPEERLPIATSVLPRDDAVIRQAILREMERQGQTFFLHNSVQTIDLAARRLRELAPEARFITAHGQMPPQMLSAAMRRFTAGEADVLVCTTIIESGLDMPNVNTIIVDDAERLGLAQLYQLRGRVGRSSQRAFAYLLYRPERALSETAQQRLAAILDAAELGAGFQIALRDLQIRGAGNLLGTKQSGHIGAVGFTLFTQLLEDAVRRVKARADAAAEGREPALAEVQPAAAPQVAVDLPLPRRLPEDWLPDMQIRLDFYQRLAAALDAAEADEIEAELADRFGPPPAPARNLIDSVRLRTRAARIGAVEVQHDERGIVLRLAAGLRFSDWQRRSARAAGVRIGNRAMRYEPPRRSGQPLADALAAAPWCEALSEAIEACEAAGFGP